MKMFVVAVNLAVLVAMAVIYANYVHAQETDHLKMLIQIERAVAQALVN
jgi:hypothetical protein